MQEMQSKPSPVENVAIRDYALRILRERELDYPKPNAGNIIAIGPPTSNSGIVAGQRKTNSGYFLVTQTL